jgi:hypothetical protein
METPSEHTIELEALNSIRIITNAGLVGETWHRARTHRKRRIDKKWRKRYGYKRDPDPNAYLVKADGVPSIMMHPKTFKLFVKELGSQEAAAEALVKHFKEEI